MLKQAKDNQKMIKCHSLEEVRSHINNIDEQMVKLIASRGELVK